MDYGHFCCGSSGVLLCGHFRLDQSFSSYFSVARDMRIRFHQWKGYHADPGGLKGTLWEKTSLHDTLASLGHKVRIWATETHEHREYKKKTTITHHRTTLPKLTLERRPTVGYIYGKPSFTTRKSSACLGGRIARFMRVHTGKMEAWAAGLWDTVQNLRKKNR